MNQSEAILAASQLMKQGLAVLPLFGISDGKCTCRQSHAENTNSAGKHPSISGWKEASTANLAHVESLFQNAHELNIGIHCEKSGILVVDVDPRSGGDESLDRLISYLEGDWPEKTVTVRTGYYEKRGKQVFGRHYYFRCPDNLKITSSLPEFPGIDFKYNGYVVAPPSRHLTGVEYTFESGCSFDDLEVSPLPENLFKAISTSVKAKLGGHQRLEFVAEYPSTRYGLAALNSEVQELAAAPEGTRNNQLVKSLTRMGSLIAGGELNKLDVVGALRIAALKTGLPAEEVEELVTREGGPLDFGMQSPRSVGSLVDSKNGLGASLTLVDWYAAFTDAAQEEWYVPGVICAGRSHVILSDAGVGKTLLMHDVAAALASGRSVLGGAAREPIRVLYLDYENTVIGDVVPHLRDMGYDPSELENLMYASFPELPALDTPAGGTALSKALDTFNPDLVVIDTVSKTISGDENLNTTWLQWISNAGNAIKSRGIASVRLDHVGKNPEAGMRGGSAKKGELDLLWYLEAKRKSNLFTIKLQKTRVPVPMKEYEIERQFEPLRHILIGNGGTPDWASLVKSAEKVEFCQRLLDREQVTYGKHRGLRAMWEEYKSLLAAEGISRSIFYGVADPKELQKEPEELEVPDRQAFERHGVS